VLETQEQSVVLPVFVVSEPAPVDFQEAHAAYIESGGMLDPDSFQFIAEFTPSEESAALLSHHSYAASTFQAEHLDAYTGVGLSVEEKQLYALLRNQLITGELPEVAGERPQKLSDQRLMAEILRLTSPEKMVLFESKYPQIFPE